MSLLDSYREAFLKLPDQIRAAEVEAEAESEVTITMADGVWQGASSSNLTELFVRATAERTGFTYTQNLDEDPLEVIERAYEGSLYLDDAAPEWMNKFDVNYDSNADRSEIRSGDDYIINVSLLLEKAKEINSDIQKYAPELLNKTLALTFRFRRIEIINTNGVDRGFSYPMISVDLLAVSKKYGSLSKERTYHSIDEMSASLFEKDISRWKFTWLPDVKFSSGVYPAVLSGNVMTNILLTSWQMFSAQNYISGNTPYSGKLGEKIANSILQISDLTISSDSGFCFKMDCQGTIAKDLEVIKDGVLTGLMQNLSSANTLEMPVTGNAGRKNLLSGNIHTETQVIPKNFGILPGTAGLKDLFGSLHDGIYICESFDEFHSINVVSGDFSIPCTGILIKDRKPVGRMEGLTFNGKVQDLLGDIEAIGNDLETLPITLLNSYAVFSPSVYVSKLNISI